MTDVTVRNTAAVAIEAAVMGDLKGLTPEQRLVYYRQVCESVGLNPLTRPFEYITLNGRLTLYARKDATDQIRATRRISITKLEREAINGVYVVTAYAQSADGRQDSSIGAVPVDGLKGDALANAMMKAETKAKRRVTLSIGGLGMLDETELETIAASDMRVVQVSDTGEIEQPKPAQPVVGPGPDDRRANFEQYLVNRGATLADFLAYMDCADWDAYLATGPTQSDATKHVKSYLAAIKEG